MRILETILISTIIFGYINAKDTNSTISLLNNGVGRSILRVYNQCDNSIDMFKCFKVQISKLVGRALKIQNIKLLDGVSIVKKMEDFDQERSARDQTINSDLDNLSDKSLDQIFFSRLIQFIQNHQIQVNVPRLLAFGQHNTEDMLSNIAGEEGRKKDKKKNYLGPFIAAVLLKAGILKIAYHSIAIVAGKALIVGKIALIISAIIGLKKLVSGDSHEKTTYEIVKHPQVQNSHTYSSSHGEYEGGHEGGSSSYRRSILNDDLSMGDKKAYHAYAPSS